MLRSRRLKFKAANMGGIVASTLQLRHSLHSRHDHSVTACYGHELTGRARDEVCQL